MLPSFHLSVGSGLKIVCQRSSLNNLAALVLGWDRAISLKLMVFCTRSQSENATGNV
jgi:hypothetical protein